MATKCDTLSIHRQALPFCTSPHQQHRRLMITWPVGHRCPVLFAVIRSHRNVLFNYSSPGQHCGQSDWPLGPWLRLSRGGSSVAARSRQSQPSSLISCADVDGTSVTTTASVGRRTWRPLLLSSPAKIQSPKCLHAA